MILVSVAVGLLRNVTLFDELLQPSQRGVPLQRHPLEVLPGCVEAFGLDVPDALAAAPGLRRLPELLVEAA